MSHTKEEKRAQASYEGSMRDDVTAAYDMDAEPQTITCPSCGEKIAVGKTGTAIGGGTAAGASASA